MQVKGHGVEYCVRREGLGLLENEVFNVTMQQRTYMYIYILNELWGLLT